MFEQAIGNPANAFIIIIAVVVGFVSAMTFIDSKEKFKQNKINEPFDKKK
jgi:hypothetical protein